ncbi:MAG: hypothetical protein GY719_06885 [bacterium]|nr:hypothetical protein [bacterium]
MKQRLLLLMLCACALACDSANPVAPAGAVLSVTANPSQITLTGQSTITVTGFKPDANPLNPGTQIIVSTSIGNLFHPTTGLQISIVEIDGNGRAVAILRADGRQGSATVTATLATQGGGTGGGGGGGGDGDGDGGGGGTTTTVGASASTTVQVGANDADKPSVLITANPSTIPTGGSSRIRLLGRNSDDTPVSAGQRIRLTADFGLLVEDGGNANSPEISEVVTDANGEAFATFIAGDRSSTMGMVRAILGTSDEATATIIITAALGSLDLTANPRTIARDDAGVAISVQAVVLDAQGSPIQAVLVRFDSLGSYDNNPQNTNSDGIAAVTLTVRAIDVQGIGENGTFTIRATATSEGNTEEDSVEITVQGAP